jgi:ParB-like chromosome segregation protein Spo0J
MVELHTGRGLTEVEESWLVRTLVREHHLTQGAVAERLGRHKSWVCRRLILAEGLEPQVQAWVRLGLVAARSAVTLAALPRGNQGLAGEIVMQKGLTVRQTHLLVEQLLAGDDAQQHELIARWREQGPAPAQTTARCTPRKARSEGDWMSSDIVTLHRTAARLQARLMGNALCAPPDAVRQLMTESLRALLPVLHSLAQVISDNTC